MDVRKLKKDTFLNLEIPDGRGDISNLKLKINARVDSWFSLLFVAFISFLNVAFLIVCFAYNFAFS